MVEKKEEKKEETLEPRAHLGLWWLTSAMESPPQDVWESCRHCINPISDSLMLQY